MAKPLTTVREDVPHDGVAAAIESMRLEADKKLGKGARILGTSSVPDPDHVPRDEGDQFPLTVTANWAPPEKT